LRIDIVHLGGDDQTVIVLSFAGLEPRAFIEHLSTAAARSIGTPAAGSGSV
jgi:hypothetical protein